LILFDRNDSSYIFLASLTIQGLNFTGRCSKSSFKAARNMFKQQVTDSNIVTLKASTTSQEKVPRVISLRSLLRLGLPEKITVLRKELDIAMEK
jgi:hypothetical protein